MTPTEFVIWLKEYILKQNFAEQKTWDIVNKLNQVKLPGTQLKIQFPDYPDTVKLKTVYVSDSTSGKDTFTTFNYSDDGTIY